MAEAARDLTTVYVRWYCEACKYHHEVRANRAQIDTIPAYTVIDLGTTDLRCKKLRYKEEEPAVAKQIYKEGQRVRIEWPDGTIVEGVLTRNIQVGRTAFMPWEVGHDGRDVTILSEPRPQEPAEPGSVVWARMENPDNSQIRQWVKVPKRGISKQRWHDGAYLLQWDSLHDVTLEDPFVDDLFT